MRKNLLLFNFLLWGMSFCLYAQEVPILNSSVDANGRIQIEVNSSTEYYYVLYTRHTVEDTTYLPVSMKLGESGTTTLSESLAAYPPEHYRVLRHRKDASADTDGDGISDIAEMNELGRLAPLNPAKPINTTEGLSCLRNKVAFSSLSYQGNEVLIDTHLEGLEFVKFYILDADTDHPSVYFMNTVKYRAHHLFARAQGIPTGGRGNGSDTNGQMRGEIIYHPRVLSPNGRTGVYRFEFEPNDSYSFEAVRLGYEILAKNILFLENNWAYYPMPNAALPLYNSEKSLYDASRIAILLEENIYDEVNYIPFNLAEGYGLLRVMQLEERPNSREIVLYESLPNEMPRVGGIITTVPQTPLSHVNLRAIQDNVPNAFIRGALALENISSLVGKYVYYQVRSDNFEIREATLAEVENHYAVLRPKEDEIADRDLSIQIITPLDEITFEQSVSFGVKAANIATMRSFGFPEGTIPNGFAIPFYFYDEFMKYNGFYDKAEQMIQTPGFLDNFDTQDEMLSDFRKTIKDGEMPDWMWQALSDMQASFPAGTSIRCRSSTNNEDLPGFSGAGLYDSKTQHPDEGHISKSIKQVYASLWNFRAFDERQFYRIDHFIAAMGVLVHPNYSDEKANGVGVTTDPIYQSTQTYYLNTQIGEDLVTNPDALSIPEEILLNAQTGYTLVRPSNQTANGEQIMTVDYLNELRGYLRTIQEEFQTLYNAPTGVGFAMEIEYKITKENKLAIKQARPWAVYWEDVSNGGNISTDNPLGISIKNYPNPFTSSTEIEFILGVDAEIELRIYDMQGKEVQVLMGGKQSKGLYRMEWNRRDTQGVKQPGGIYIYKLWAKNQEDVFHISKQMLLY